VAVAAVIDPWGRDIHPPGGSGDLPRRVVAVADHQPATVLVAHLGVRVKVGATLGLQRHREHLAGGQATQLIQIGRHRRPASIVSGVRVLVDGID
jgi:hypothetical protein